MGREVFALGLFCPNAMPFIAINIKMTATDSQPARCSFFAIAGDMRFTQARLLKTDHRSFLS
jgi:hypothetical protein